MPAREVHLPWWGIVALIFLAVEYVKHDFILDGSSALNFAGQPSEVSPAARRLDVTGWLMPKDISATLPSPLSPQEFHRNTAQAREGTNLTYDEAETKDTVDPFVDPYVPPATLEKKTLSVTVPCLDFFTYQLIVPCGNLTVPPAGIDFRTFFGQYHLPGSAYLVHSVRNTEKELSRYTVLFIIVGIVGWSCYTFCIPSNRERFVSKVRAILSGQMMEEDDDEDEENPLREKEMQARLDPMSPEFIAPGNIYRLLAVLHPGIIGCTAWLGYACRALIVAYMQFWLPWQIICDTLKRWRWLGIKSPLWFLANCGTFFAMVTALGTLCHMFAERCARHITRGAEANMYILSHDNPSDGDGPGSKRSSMSSQASQQAKLEGLRPASTFVRVARVTGLSEEVEHVYDSLNQGLGSINEGVSSAYNTYKSLERPELSGKSANFNEYFWCNVAMFLNVVMSILLELAMFLKVATFTGRFDNVAMTAVSLYFIFDLDDRVMEADPKLKQRYRRAVAAQTVPKAPEFRPRLIPIISHISAAFVQVTVPMGLVGIVLIAWRRNEDGFVIGGDGLTLF